MNSVIILLTIVFIILDYTAFDPDNSIAIRCVFGNIQNNPLFVWKRQTSVNINFHWNNVCAMSLYSCFSIIKPDTCVLYYIRRTNTKQLNR